MLIVMNKQTKKFILNIVILVVITALALFFVLKDDAQAIFSTLKNANLLYVLLCIFISLIGFMINSLILVLLTKIYKPDYKYRKGFLNDMVGRFFSGITPSSTGGQFSQAYTFSKQGVSLTNAASILLMMFIIYEVSLVFFSGITLVYAGITHTIPNGYIPIFGLKLNVISLSVIGFIISFALISISLLFAINRRIHHFVVNIVCKVGTFLHLIKKNKVEDKKIEMNAKIESFRLEIKRLLSNLKILVECLALYIVSFLFSNSIPFFAANACGANIPISEFINALNYSNFTYLITQMIPIPGASGGAEYVFSLMYSELIPNFNILKATILVWRFVGFYFGLFFGAIVFLTYHESPKMETLHYSSRTLLEIEVIHLNNEYRSLEKKDSEKINNIEIGDVSDYFNQIKDELSANLKANERAWKKDQKPLRKRKKKNDEERK